MAFNNAINANQQGIQYQSSAGSWTGVDAGTAGNVLTSNGTGVAPSFQSPSSSSAPAGTLQYFSTAGGTSFSGWLRCDGSVVSQATYPSLFSAVGLLNGPGTVWTKTTIDSFSGNTFRQNGLKYLNNTYISVLGNIGSSNLATSTDANSWTVRKINSISTINDISYGNSNYVLGSTSGVFTSTDLSTFTYTAISFISSGSVTSLAFGNSLFVCSGSSTSVGVLGSSTDGITWTQRNSPIGSTNTVTSIVFGNSLFVAVGLNRIIVTSTDGISWDTRYPGIGTTTTFGNCLTYGNIFVGVGPGNIKGTVASSTDFILWAGRDSNASSALTTIFNVSYLNSIYIYSGNTGSLGTSTDGITWSARTSGTVSNINALTYGTVYVYAGAGGALATSTDAITWTSRTSGTTSTIAGLTYGTVYVYGGNGGVLATSTDAITWTSRTSGTTSGIRSLAYSGSLGLYAYSGTGGALATSTDAITWNSRTSGTTADLTIITFQNSLFVAGGSNGVIVTSTDGISWNTSSVPLPNTAGAFSLTGLTYTSSTFYACFGGSGISILATSTDAVTWTLNDSMKNYNNIGTPGNIIYGGGKYVYADNRGYVYSSTDSITWQKNPSNIEVGGTPIISYGNSMYKVVYSGNSTNTFGGSSVATSTDAVTWIPENISSSEPVFFNSFTYGNRFVGFVNGVLSGALTQYPIDIYITNTSYSYNTSTQFQLPKEIYSNFTLENTNNYQRALYIKT